MSFKHYLSTIIIFAFSTYVCASDEVFELESFNFSMENDAVINTDYGYTHGGRTSLLFYRGDTSKSSLNIPFTSYENTNNFISFAYANQMFTPYKVTDTELIEDDRPYAGISYFELALHQANDTALDSLTLQVGMLGESSGMEELQKSMHKYLDVHEANGWEYQLKDEFIFQINYMHKWRLTYDKLSVFDSVLVPYWGFDLGNKSVSLSTGGLYRIGFNIPEDFGVNSMDEGSFSSMPTKPKHLSKSLSNWSAFFNLASGANLVGRDIFLDGNTFADSHSVDKNYMNAYISAGITLRYKRFFIDFMHNYYSKEYKERGLHREYKGYSSLIFTYNFN